MKSEINEDQKVNRRERLCEWLFDNSSKPYAKFIKRSVPWDIPREALIQYAPDTLGHAVGDFLISNDYRLIPKLERHDAYHVITDFDSHVIDEIAMQFFFIGNGKRSLYLWFVVLVGGLLFPEYWNYFKTCVGQGRSAISFSQWDIKLLLSQPLENMKKAIFGSQGSRHRPLVLNNKLSVLEIKEPSL